MIPEVDLINGGGESTGLLTKVDPLNCPVPSTSAESVGDHGAHPHVNVDKHEAMARRPEAQIMRAQRTSEVPQRVSGRYE